MSGLSRQALKEELKEFSATVLQAALDRTRDEVKAAVLEAVASGAVQKDPEISGRRQPPEPLSDALSMPVSIAKAEDKKIPPMHSWMRQKPMRNGESQASLQSADSIDFDDPHASASLRHASVMREQASSPNSRRSMSLDWTREKPNSESMDATVSYLPLIQRGGSASAASLCQRVSHEVRGAVSSPGFEQMAACFVIMNAVLIGVETSLINPKKSNHGVHDHGAMEIVHQLEFIFCVIFVSELLVRIFTYGSDFFVGDMWQWNMFDTLIVGLQVMEQLSEEFHGRLLSVSSIKILRLVRVFRIIRLLRVLRLVDELQRIIISIVNSLSSLVWVLMLLAVLIYFFAVVFTSLALIHVVPDDPQFEHIMHFYGSLPRTSLTLFESVFGGLSWDEPAQLLIDCVSPYACVLYCFYIAFSLIALMNVVTGVFVDKALRSAHAAEESSLCNQVASIFFDENDPHRQISWEFFQSKLSCADMADYFRAIDIDATEAKNLFTLLDTDNSGGVDCAELINGLLRLRGNAGALEVSLMMREISYMYDRIDALVWDALSIGRKTAVDDGEPGEITL
eukprot:TRINITY_DN53138_c0_g3_i1.p1 TRINITY_DN53138_c0_g3~~TRINITY_DN53138_c0_g3_i1.p1  ORF type:complete len:567 (-),score=108.84 TRINITY_DN53138_c0_g3_i1:197-1897(-)